jgi:hypothetical protein
MFRLFAFPIALAASTAALSTPPPLPDPPPDLYPLDPQGLVFPPVPRAHDGYGEDWGDDPLGDVWEMGEVASWTGVWIRRGRSPTFDGYWTNPNGERVRAILDIRSRGDEVVAMRRHPDGQWCRYSGAIGPDRVQVTGSYVCSWERTPMPWRAQIVRMESVTPEILRRGR